MRKIVVTMLASAGVAASLVLAAPAGAAAGPQQSCTSTRASSVCSSPGNVQINDAPPFVMNFPMYGYFPWIL